MRCCTRGPRRSSRPTTDAGSPDTATNIGTDKRSASPPYPIALRRLAALGPVAIEERRLVWHHPDRDRTPIRLTASGVAVSVAASAGRFAGRFAGRDIFILKGRLVLLVFLAGAVRSRTSSSRPSARSVLRTSTSATVSFPASRARIHCRLTRTGSASCPCASPRRIRCSRTRWPSSLALRTSTVRSPRGEIRRCHHSDDCPYCPRSVTESRCSGYGDGPAARCPRGTSIERHWRRLE